MTDGSVHRTVPTWILIADDEPQIRQLGAHALRHYGYKVDMASNGAEAWSKIQKKKYDLLLTDFNMPLLNGLELIEKINASHIEIKTILMSGAMPLQMMKMHPVLQFQETLHKPFAVSGILNAVKSAAPLKKIHPDLVSFSSL